VTVRPRIQPLLFALMDRSRWVRGGETALSPERKSGSPPAAANEGARGGTMGSPALNLCRCTGYRGIYEAVCDLAGVAA
jgi:hypothetical protein